MLCKICRHGTPSSECGPADAASAELPQQRLWRNVRWAAFTAWAAALQGCRWVNGQLGVAGRLHLAMFYCYGLYYAWGKRLTGALRSLAPWV